MPPIMGAVAFVMAEFTQIPYLTIVTVATGPIILYYITLMAFIHFEAKKHIHRANEGSSHPLRPDRLLQRGGGTSSSPSWSSS